MNRSREQLLARARLAGDQYAHVACRDFLRQRKQLLHGRRSAQQIVHALAITRLSAQRFQLFLRAVHFGGALQDQSQLDHVRRIGYGVVRSAFHRLNHQRVVFFIAEDDHRRPRNRFPDLVHEAYGQRLVSSGARGTQIQQRHFAPSAPVVRPREAHIVAVPRFEIAAQRASDRFHEPHIFAEK